jgi:hypothetical protein
MQKQHTYSYIGIISVPYPLMWMKRSALIPIFFFTCLCSSVSLFSITVELSTRRESTYSRRWNSLKEILKYVFSRWPSFKKNIGIKADRFIHIKGYGTEMRPIYEYVCCFCINNLPTGIRRLHRCITILLFLFFLLTTKDWSELI